LKHEEHIAMSKQRNAIAVSTIGIDTGKNTLHMIGLDEKGEIILREKISRSRIASRLVNVGPCLVGIEAGMATHYMARELVALGHVVKQVPPAFAKLFRPGHKNDFRDAHAVAEAVQRSSTRCVPIKTDDQLDLQALHRMRSRLIGDRTAVINQLRGFLLEHGIAVRQGHRFLRHVNCERLMTVPGIGPIIASAMVAAIGDGAAFAKGRDYAAWLGLVPRQMSTGDRTILGRITKRGNRYLRMLFIQGARAIQLHPKSWAKHSFGPWLTAAARRMHCNVLTVALANKLARIALTVLVQDRNYETRVARCGPVSFNGLVGSGEQHGRYREAQRFGGLEIDHQIEFGRLLDRQLTRLCPAWNFIHEVGGALQKVR
jgi:transposase